MQPQPGSELAECAREIEKLCPHLVALPRARRITKIAAVGGSILRDDQKLLHARSDKTLGLAQHVGGGACAQFAAQLRNDAEDAAVVSTIGKIQIGLMPRRMLDALS